MNSNDDKTILGESAFHTPNNDSNNKDTQDKKESTQNEQSKNVTTSKTDKDKVSKGTAIGGAAIVGAAAVGGVAAGTAYSEEIKEKYNDLFGDDSKAVAENNTDVKETATVSENIEATNTDTPDDFVSSTNHISNESEPYVDTREPQEHHIRVDLPEDEFGNVHAVNIIDVNEDGIADKVEEITVFNIPEGGEEGYLTSSGYEPDPSMIIDEPFSAGSLEPDSIIDDNIAYEPIDYANFEDGTLQPIDDALLASDESLGGDYITDPSITEDFTLEGELQSEDYTASIEDYSLDSDVASEEFTASTEDYSLDSDLSSEDYLASNEDYSLDSNISSEDYAANSEDYLASNEDYQSELENTDFDNTDYSSDSFDIGFSDDLI